jgi:arsenate reductase-like glutaredoxin family protein
MSIDEDFDILNELDEKIKRNALHESGHAMMYYYFKIPFISVNIIPNHEKKIAGAVITKINFSPESVCNYFSWDERLKIIPIGIKVLYAGPMANIRDSLNSRGLGSEKIKKITIHNDDLDFDSETYKNSDSKKIKELGKIFAKDFTKYCLRVPRENWTDEELENWLNGLALETDSLVSKYWTEIKSIATALIERKTLTENEVKEIIQMEYIRKHQHFDFGKHTKIKN